MLQVLVFWYYDTSTHIFVSPSVNNFHRTQILGLTYPGLRIQRLTLQISHLVQTVLSWVYIYPFRMMALGETHGKQVITTTFTTYY